MLRTIKRTLAKVSTKGVLPPVMNTYYIDTDKDEYDGDDYEDMSQGKY